MTCVRVCAFLALAVCLHCLTACCVSGQATVQIHAEEAGEEGDLDGLEEGRDRVVLRCATSGKTAGHSVVWEHEDRVLAPGERIQLESIQQPIRDDVARDEDAMLTISPVVGSDRGSYSCKIVRDGGGAVVSNRARVRLTVFSFPPESSPSCSPAGTLTADIGGALALGCSTPKGYPAVSLSILSRDGVVPPDELTTVETGDAITASFLFRANRTSDGLVFSCVVFSSRYPGRLRTCSIGPVRIGGTSAPSDAPPLAPSAEPGDPVPSAALPSRPDGDPRGCREEEEEEEEEGTTKRFTDLSADPCFPWFAGAVAAAILLVASVSVNLALCCKRSAAAVGRVGDARSGLDRVVVSRDAPGENWRRNPRTHGIGNRCFVNTEPLPNAWI